MGASRSAISIELDSLLNYLAGTGKTTVVVQILRRILQNPIGDLKILMSASTHNGNILPVVFIMKMAYHHQASRGQCPRTLR